MIRSLIKSLIKNIGNPEKKNSVQSYLKDTYYNSNNIKMYDAFKKELSGYTGDRVTQLLIESCRLCPMAVELPTKLIKYIHEESIKGRRAEAIAMKLQPRLPNIVKKDLESICRTVIFKARTALNRARSEKLGIRWYVWQTSGDIRVRDSHRNMQGVLVPWDEPPSPEYLNGEKTEGYYHAGEGVDCRCYTETLIDLKDLANKWPMKVYWNRRIQLMTKTQFKTIY